MCIVHMVKSMNARPTAVTFPPFISDELTISPVFLSLNDANGDGNTAVNVGSGVVGSGVVGSGVGGSGVGFGVGGR